MPQKRPEIKLGPDKRRVLTHTVLRILLIIFLITQQITSPVLASYDPRVEDRNSLDASDGSPSNAIVIDGAGNVGLTDPTPDALLDVNGSVIIEGTLTLNGTTLQTGAAWVVDGGNTTNATLTVGTNDDQKLALETNGVTAITVDDNGNVGINDTSPDFLFDVAGTLNAEGATTLSSTLVVTDDVTASAELAVNGATASAGSLALIGEIAIGESAAPTHTSGYGKLHVSSTDYQLYFKDRSGNSQKLTFGNNGAVSVDNLADAIHDSTANSVYIGSGSGAASDSTSLQNVAVGVGSLAADTTGDNNTAQGYRSLYSNTSGSNNTAHGHSALYSNTTGSNNIAIGPNALYSNTSGTNNFAAGYSSLHWNTTGGSNIAHGTYSLVSNVIGSNNIASGQQSLYSNTNGDSNIATGANALYTNTTGSHNIATGYNALYSNTTASNNIASGYHALYANTTGASNIASGYNSLVANTTGSYNVALGYGTLDSNTTGTSNIASGFSTLGANTTGSHNVAFGQQSLATNTTGNYNVALGLYSLLSNSTGSSNVALGPSAGRYETASDTFYIDNQDRTNTAGDKAGALLYGTFNATPANQTLTINATATVAQNLVVSGTGNSSLAGNFGIGDTSPDAKLDVNGSAIIEGTLTFNGTTLQTATDLVVNGGNSYGNEMTVGTNDDQGLALETNGVTAVTLDDNGNVGIGTSSPGAKLDVKGSGTGHVTIGEYAASDAYGAISLAGNTLDTSGYNFASSPGDTNLFVNRPSGKSIYFRENNLDYVTFLTGGNVGIGDTTPDYLLDVAGTLNADGATTLGSTLAVTSTSTLTGDVTASAELAINGATAAAGSLAVNGVVAMEETAAPALTSGYGKVYASSSDYQLYYMDRSGNSQQLTFGNNGAVSIDNLADAIHDSTANSVYLGSGAGAASGSGSSRNTGVGISSLAAATSGDDNTALGYRSLYANTTGSINLAIGTQALNANTTGGYNIAMGYQPLYSTTTASSSNIAIGYQTMYSVTDSSNAIAIGNEALQNANTGGNPGFGANSNIAIGNYALQDTTTGYSNIAIGKALINNTTGIGNVSIDGHPYAAMNANTSGGYNVGIGSGNLSANTTGSNNIGIGANNTAAVTTGSNNIGIGAGAMGAITTGSSNIGFGNSVGGGIAGASTRNIVMGECNFCNIAASTINDVISMGYESMRYSTGSQNVGIGTQVMRFSSGSYNTALGYQAIFDGGGGNSGTYNVAIGAQSLYVLNGGSFTTAIGAGALGSTLFSPRSTAVGYQAGYGSSANNANNSSFGYQAGYALTTGSNNIAMGYAAGNNITTGNGNIIIGYDIDAPSATQNGQLSIGNLIYGTSIDGTGTTASTSGKVGIGTSAPEDLLEIQATEATDAIFTLDADEGDDNADTWEIRSDASDNQFYLTNHASDLFTIQSDGDTGIGTASPSTKLEVSGTFRAGNTTDTYMTYDSSADNITLRKGSYYTSFGFDDANGFTPTIGFSGGPSELIINAGDIYVKPTAAAGLVNAIKIENTNTTINTSATGISLRAGGNVAKGLIAYTNQTAWGVGDLTFGINSSANNTVASLSDTIMTIQGSSGQIGIGDTSPDALLDVNGAAIVASNLTIGQASAQNGNILIKGNTSGTITIKPASAAGTYTLTLPTDNGDANEVLTTDGSGNLSWEVAGAGSDEFNDGGDTAGGDRTLGNNDDYDLTLETNGVAAISITDNGYVGIGTASPRTALDLLNGTILSKYIVALNAQNSYSAPSFISLVPATASGPNRIIGGFNGGGGDIALYAGALNGSYDPTNSVNPLLLYLKSDGKVGIGTTAPEDLFEVQAAEATDAIITLDADDGDDNADTWEIRSDASDNNFYITNHATDLFTVESGGDVGIGVTNPIVKFDVRGDIMLFVDQTSAEGIEFNPTAGGPQQIYSTYISGSDRSLILGSYANRANQLVLATTGNVGIGDTTPDAMLHVNGSFLAEGAVDFGAATTSLEIPNAAAPTVDAVGEIAIDTTDGVLVGYTDSAKVFAYPTKQFTVTLFDDGDWNSEAVPIWQAPADMGITIVKVHATTMGGGSSSLEYNIEERGLTALGSAGTDIYADKFADEDSETETSFTNSAIAASAYLVLTTNGSAETNTVNSVTLTVYYTLTSD